MVLVSNVTELEAALSGAQPGNTIELAAGNYGDVSLDGYVYSDFVTLISADPAQPAIFETLHIKNSSHLRVDNIKIEHILDPSEPDWVSAMRIDKSHYIEVLNSEFSGSSDGNYANDGQGLLALDSTNITIAGNEFHDLKTGAGFGRSENIELRDNSFHDIRSDGVNIGTSSHVVVEDNTFRDFYPEPGDHPDMIQVFNNGATQDTTDIVIRNNTLSQGQGAAVQGIFIEGVPKGEVGISPFSMSDVVIEGNSISLDSAQGIWVADVSGLDIIGNHVAEANGTGLTPIIRTIRTEDATVANNTAPSFDDLDSDGITYLNNTITDSSAPIEGTEGDDFITGDDGNDIISGGDGADEIHGAGGNDELTGGAGNDRLFGEAGDDTLFGGDGNDAFNGGGGADQLHGGNGNDGFYGGGGNDRLYGDAGDDTIFGDGGNDTLNGGSGSDELHGGSGHDGFFGGGGNDRIFGEAGNDTLFGDGGNDMLNGGGGADELHGGSGNDGFYGGGGDDIISGDAGNDTLFGNGGNDTLTGGTGDDLLVGDSGNDTFVFESNSGHDTIGDFEVGVDHIDLTALNLYNIEDLNDRISTDGADTVIDLDGADASLDDITIVGVTGLTETDFSI